MKRTVTTIFRGSRTFGLFMVALTWNHLSGQTTHNVSVTSNVFAPNELTISSGDKVVWSNTQGSHNVNGQQSTFSDNPVSFGNQVGSGWVYEFVFSTPGTYNYQCDPHAALGMTGRIIVEETATGLSLKRGSPHFRVYPNPAHDFLHVETEEQVVSLSLVSVTGRRLVTFREGEIGQVISLDGISPGIYFVEIITDDQKFVVTRFIKK